MKFYGNTTTFTHLSTVYGRFYTKTAALSCDGNHMAWKAQIFTVLPTSGLEPEGREREPYELTRSPGLKVILALHFNHIVSF